MVGKARTWEVVKYEGFSLNPNPKMGASMSPFPSMRWSGMVSKDSIKSKAARAASKESHRSVTSRAASKESRKSYFSHTFPDVEIADGTASFPPNRLMHEYHLDNIKHFMKDGVFTF